MSVFLSLVRQFAYKPFFSILNLLGLAAGIATCTLILLYTDHELNYNSWVADQDLIYRVEGQFIGSGSYMTNTMTPLKPAIDAGIPEVAASARFYLPTWPVKRDNFVEYEQISLVDEEFLDMFPLDFVTGSRESAFATPSSIAISESMARKYFGNISPIGESLTINQTLPFTVSGVFRDLPDDSDMTLNFIAGFQDKYTFQPGSWNNAGLRTYVRLQQNAAVAEVMEKLAIIVDTHRPYIGDAPGDMRSLFRLFQQPFGDIHLGSSGRTPSNDTGQYPMIYGFIAIAFLILTISAFNYIGLATARALEREKEICLRKVLGANRTRIVRHIMGESIVMTLLAAFVGLGLAELALPWFSEILQAEFTGSDLLQPVNLILFVAGSTILGVMAGLYPAFFVAGFRPVRFLNGGRSQRGGLAKIRTGLVFVQFVVAISLISGAVTITRQMTLIQSKNLGYDQSDILVLRGVNREETASRAEVLMERLKTVPGVDSVARSSVVPMDNNSHYEGLYSRFLERAESASVRVINIDYNFIDAYGARLLAGRGPEERFANDEINFNALYSQGAETGSNVVLNETAVRGLGYDDPQAILGETIQLELEAGAAQPLTVIGVVADMYFRSLRNSIEPKVYFYDPSNLNSMSVRMRDNRAEATVREIWVDLYPDTPFRADYLEDRIDSGYVRERSQLQLFIGFSGVAIILSLVGLAGMVLNSVAHRTREISLRRVVGASVGNIIRLFTWQYLKPVLIAIIPASGVAWYFLDQWLRKYSERVEMGPGLFALSGGTVLVLTLLIVAALVTRTALTPPINALYHE